MGKMFLLGDWILTIEKGTPLPKPTTFFRQRLMVVKRESLDSTASSAIQFLDSLPPQMIAYGLFKRVSHQIYSVIL